MSDHLPECLLNDPDHDCICDFLRACEARVEEESGFGCCDALWNKGYAAALDAARDAVAAVKSDTGYGKTDALAAIDALRGES